MARRPKLGQHFLADEGMRAQLLEAIAPQSEDVFVEIGPGKGALTLPLLAAGAQVTAIELDERLAQSLPGRAGKAAARLNVIHGDAAKQLPIPDADRWRLAGNLPYAISSPVIELLIAAETKPVDVHLLLQLEFAQRLVAPAGCKDYSRLTVAARSFFDAELLFEVPAESFAPPPRVESAVVRLTPNNAACAIEDLELYRDLLRRAFGQRRKQLRNTLDFKGIAALAPYAARRAEELEIKDYVFMANELARR